MFMNPLKHILTRNRCARACSARVQGLSVAPVIDTVLDFNDVVELVMAACHAAPLEVLELALTTFALPLVAHAAKKLTRRVAINPLTFNSQAWVTIA